MGADGHINITKPAQILQFVLQIIIHVIKEKYKDDIQKSESLGQKFIITLNEETQNIQFYTETDVPDEKIIINTISLEDTYYIEIYNYLVSEFNNNLNYYKIPGSAWHRCGEIEKDLFNMELARLDKFNWNYTYWDTEGWYDSTMYDFFELSDYDAPTEIYNDTIESFSFYEKDRDLYETFIDSFPSAEKFIEIMYEYKDIVELEDIQMWT